MLFVDVDTVGGLDMEVVAAVVKVQIAVGAFPFASVGVG